jgi:glutamyl-tRNA reductase
MHGPLAALNRSENAERQQLLAMLPRLLPRVDRRR